MEIKKLQYLESIYRLGSISRAAEEHYISQPAMTKSIRTLEDELGIQLLERTNRGIRFTYQGEQFMPHVMRILSDIRKAEDEADDLRQARSQRLVMNVSTVSSLWILPMIFSEFALTVPGCTFDILENTLDGMFSSLLDEKSDLAFTIMPEVLPHNIVSLPLMTSELELLVSTSHRLAGQSKVSFSDLDREIVYAYPPGSLVRSVIDSRCNEAGVAPYIQFPSSQQSITHKLVSLGAGVALIVRGKMPVDIPDDLVSIGFDDPVLFEEGFLYKKGHHLNRIAKSFISFMRKRCL